MKISTAAVEDIPQLCGLLATLFIQEDDFHPDAHKQAVGLRQIIEQAEVGHILALREGDTVIGMVSLLYTVSTACGGKVALLEDMIVLPPYRGAGLGGELLQAAIEQAKREHCLRITLLTDRANNSAIRFYQRHGFGMSGMLPLRLALD